MKTIDLTEAVGAVRRAIAGLKDPSQKDSVLRACLSLNAPDYREYFNCDPKPF